MSERDGPAAAVLVGSRAPLAIAARSAAPVLAVEDRCRLAGALDMSLHGAAGPAAPVLAELTV